MHIYRQNMCEMRETDMEGGEGKKGFNERENGTEEDRRMAKELQLRLGEQSQGSSCVCCECFQASASFDNYPLALENLGPSVSQKSIQTQITGKLSLLVLPWRISVTPSL